MSTTTTSHTIRECKRGQHFSTPTQSDGAMARARRSGKGQTAPRYRQIRGYRLPSATVESAHSSNQGSQRLRCCSAYSCLRSTVQGRNPNASNPRKGKALKSPPIGCFSEFSRRAQRSRVFWPPRLHHYALPREAESSAWIRCALAGLFQGGVKGLQRFLLDSSGRVDGTA